MKQKFQIYYCKNSQRARIDLTIRYDDYSEMSELAREAWADEKIEPEKENVFYKHHYFFNYTNLLGNLISADEPFECIKDLFVAVSDVPMRFFQYQLAVAEQDYKSYIEQNDFSKSFFEIYANYKRITINRRLYEVVDNHFVPLEKIDSNTDDIVYGYETDNIKDLVFSTIHFALENGYKLVKCEHCGKWFFKSGDRKGSRKKYCNRNSTYSGYKHLKCEQAVRNINQELQREKKRIYNSMTREHPSTEQFVRDFLDECTEYMVKIKECASVQNLSEYWNFLKDKKGRWK